MRITAKIHVVLIIVATATSVSAAKLSQAQINYFEKQVRPLLADNCYKCHSERFGKFKGGLALDTREGVRRGGDSGPIIAGKDLKESLLYQAISHRGDLKMPKGGKLSKKQIAVLAKWIRMGAPDPREKPATPEVVESTIDVEKGREFWAFQLPKKTPVPQPKLNGWAKSDIDRIVLGPSLRNLGVAHQLYDLIGDMAADDGCSLLAAEMDINPPNPHSLHFHSRYGFEEVGVRDLERGKTVSMQVAPIKRDQ